MKHYLFTIALASLLGSAHAADKLQDFKEFTGHNICAQDPSCLAEINAIEDTAQLEQYLEKSCFQEGHPMGCLAKATWQLTFMTKPLSSGDFSNIVNTLCHTNAQQMNPEGLEAIKAMLMITITLIHEDLATPTPEMNDAIDKCETMGIIPTVQ